MTSAAGAGDRSGDRMSPGFADALAGSGGMADPIIRDGLPDVYPDSTAAPLGVVDALTSAGPTLVVRPLPAVPLPALPTVSAAPRPAVAPRRPAGARGPAARPLPRPAPAPWPALGGGAPIQASRTTPGYPAPGGYPVPGGPAPLLSAQWGSAAAGGYRPVGSPRGPVRPAPPPAQLAPALSRRPVPMSGPPPARPVRPARTSSRAAGVWTFLIVVVIFAFASGLADKVFTFIHDVLNR